jgi:hypothetical protein
VRAAKKSKFEKMRGRAMYRILSLLWLGWALVGNAAAQDFPSRPVMFTVPFAAGGPADVIARILANGMSKVLNQQFVVENTVGAGGTIGTAKVASSPPDGYSLLLMHISHAANVAFYSNLRYDPVKDFEPIGLVAESPMAIVARKDFPASNFNEFVAYLLANNEKVTYGFAGIASASHLCSLLFFSRDQYDGEWRAIQRHGACAERSARRPPRFHVRSDDQCFAACEERTGQGFCRNDSAAPQGRARASDHSGFWAARFSDGCVVRNVRAEGDAEADHRQTSGRTAEGSAGSGCAGTAGTIRCRDRAARAGEARRVARSSQSGNRQVVPIVRKAGVLAQ